MKALNISDSYKSKYLAEAIIFIEKKLKKHLNRPRKDELKKTKLLIELYKVEILTGSPEKLRSIGREFKKIFKTQKEPESYKKLLGNIFDYRAFCNSENQYFSAYKLQEHLALRVCPYCDENYVFYVKGGKSGKKTRHAFDHYFPRKFFPYFSVSLCNLIPSCLTCNSLKHDLNTLTSPLLNPHSNAPESFLDFFIKIRPSAIPKARLKIDAEAISIDIVGNGVVPKGNFERYKKVLELDHRYLNHRSHAGLIFRRVEVIQNTIKPRFPGYTNSAIKSTFFNSHSLDYQHSPLSKMETDYLNQLLP